MSIEGILLQPGEAQGVSLRGTQVDFLVTGEHAKGCSVFEFSVAPGFDTGAHYHTKIEEIFYVLEGELTLRAGDRVVQWSAPLQLESFHRDLRGARSAILVC